MNYLNIDHIVIGLGEVGSALQSILKCESLDTFKNIDTTTQQYYAFIHICFPYSKDFVKQVEAYKAKYSNGCVVIHSTVPIGTSEKCNANHSPVRGVHPNLKEGVLTFVKFVSGKDARHICQELSKFNIITKVVVGTKNTEAMKLWDTTQYGVNIMLEKEIHEFCVKNGLDFDIIYTEANKTYNQGYQILNMPQYQKFVIEHREGKIGGHCVIPNAHLLNTPSAKRLLKDNKALT